MENKQGGIMENIKIGDVMVFEGRVTRISKEEESVFLDLNMMETGFS